MLTSDRKVWVDTTATDVKGITATPGTTVGAKMVQGSSGVNGRAGFHITGYNAGATFRELIGATLAQDLKFTARTAFAFQVVYGGGSNCFGLKIPVAKIIELPNPADAEGLQEAPSAISLAAPRRSQTRSGFRHPSP